ncbi:sugar transferase [Leuconostoc gelidum subsp. gasicomitatum]|uniref:hypothetical protein n=2 Tax=Leuconostoc gasicomitatum TaxID=115778 RepID=UPI001CC69D99|nr:hypothetical protein [Leuconostoc gasicomitatum]MBZ5943814.1 sugar transferase [Leuconostoc gasicomitatum]MBZ5965547.1 sugar transferase [Leuconostoc gasicomitatum]
MTRWMTDIFQRIDPDATFKARKDVSLFAEQVGLRRLSIFRYDSAFESSEAIHSRIDGITAGVEPGDIVYYQFPTYNGKRFENFFVEHMQSRGTKIVALVHDIEFLRFPSTTTFDEIKYLNKFNAVIVHNQHMADILKANGLRVATINLTLFDYHVNEKIIAREHINKQIVVAGSLNKSVYLKNWSHNIKILAYGLKPEFVISDQVSYQGVLSPDEIVTSLPSGFGLAWDTNSHSYENSEEYAKYNNPHKVSLYLSSGLPVIVKKGTAIASVVRKYKLGLVVESLNEVAVMIEKLGDSELTEMIMQVDHFRQLVTAGYFTKRAITNAEFKIVMGYSDEEAL